MEEGLEDVRNLASHFRDEVARPDRTILVGVSLGSVVALKTIERGTGQFDGAICACAIGAGASRSWDASGDLLLAYDVVFGMPSAWGAVGDVRDDLDFETEALPKLLAEVSNPANFPAFEFARLVAGVPGRGILVPAPPAFFPGWVFSSFFYALEARAELERRAFGPFVQNLDREYSLTAAERGYLGALGVPPAFIDGWLARMNASRTLAGANHARNYVAHNADYSGAIKKPVLMLHTIIDPVVPVSQQHAYAATVAAAGRDAWLAQAFTNGNGHCAFTGPQILTTLAAFDAWLTAGVRPGPASFPAALGFVPGFEPPPMNQP